MPNDTDNDFLSRLARRSLKTVDPVSPRLPGRFEPAMIASEQESPSFSLEDIDFSEATRDSEPSPPILTRNPIRAGNPPIVKGEDSHPEDSRKIAAETSISAPRSISDIPLTVMESKSFQRGAKSHGESEGQRAVQPSVQVSPSSPFTAPEAHNEFVERADLFAMQLRLEQFIKSLQAKGPPESNAPQINPLEHPSTNYGLTTSLDPAGKAAVTSILTTVVKHPADVQFGPRQDRAEKALEPAEPTVQINIGRIEVRAAAPPTPSPRKMPQSPSLSLDEYLNRRNREAR